MNPYEIQADVLPQLPVQEANLGNPPPCPSPWCVPGVTGGPQTSSDNVHKNFPHIIIDSSSTQTCPNGVTPPWPMPSGDPDCDGFTSSREAFIGTDPTLACGPNDWPVDLNDDQFATGADILKYAPVYGRASADPQYKARFDLNGDGKISGGDLLQFAPFFGKRCTP